MKEVDEKIVYEIAEKFEKISREISEATKMIDNVIKMIDPELKIDNHELEEFFEKLIIYSTMSNDMMDAFRALVIAEKELLDIGKENEIDSDSITRLRDNYDDIKNKIYKFISEFIQKERG